MSRLRPLQVVIAIQNISYTADPRVRLIAASLRQASYDVAVISPRSPGDPHRMVDDGVSANTFAMPNFARFGLPGHVLEYLYSGAVIGAMLLYRRLRRRLDVAHICVPPHAFFPLVLTLRATGARVVVDQHDLMPELFDARYGQRRFWAPLVRASERAALRGADEVLVVNDTGAQVAERRANVPVGRITMVRNGIGELPPVSPRRSGRTTTVGYVGNMEQQDGVENLIEAARIVHASGRKDIRFVCIGEGSDLPHLRELVSTYRLCEIVEFAGLQPHAVALHRLGECDVCVQPDPRNPFNESCTMLKALEYMALGKPIVAFDLAETRLACGDAAIYAAEDSPTALAHRILELVDDPGRREAMGRLGRHRAKTMHTWSNGETALLAVYARLAPADSKTSRTEPSSPSGTARPAA